MCFAAVSIKRSSCVFSPTSSRLNVYLAGLNEPVEAMFSQLVKERLRKNGVTEAIKATDQIDLVRRTNSNGDSQL